ncbi:hypothetical protein LCGC14_2765400 [marine sediment metagenome]|uniref:Uncharacterized protein n=1 Tax=marine sediment metagenome TaxID=412755 RepID=A0A0F8YXP4_9ZZZZ
MKWFVKLIIEVLVVGVVAAVAIWYLTNYVL